MTLVFPLFSLTILRGDFFSIKEKLDMSMGLSDISAQEVVNNLSETKLKLIIKTFGEREKLQK